MPSLHPALVLRAHKVTIILSSIAIDWFCTSYKLNFKVGTPLCLAFA